jgi:hypothetical protein
MSKVIRLTLTILILLSIAAVYGCSSPTPTPRDPTAVYIVATRDFGRELLFDKEIPIEDRLSAMDALKRVANIETKYGGGFVSSIKGPSSWYPETEGDWLYYINGISARVGAADYTLREGDIEHWDFHRGFHDICPAAIVGDFPEPFLHGYGGKVHQTVVVYADGFEEQAAELEDTLNDMVVVQVLIRGIAELSEEEKENCNLIIVGAANCQLISELSELYRRLGFYVYFEDGRMIAINSEGKVQAKYGAGSGVIQATQNPWNPGGIGACESVVWMVSGVDDIGVRKAVEALTGSYSQFRYCYAVVVTDEGIIKVPQ